jgi:hypothetical protein
MIKLLFLQFHAIGDILMFGFELVDGNYYSQNE